MTQSLSNNPKSFPMTSTSGFMLATGIVALYLLVLLGLNLGNLLSSSPIFFLLFGLAFASIIGGIKSGFSSSLFFTFLFWFLSSLFFIAVQ